MNSLEVIGQAWSPRWCATESKEAVHISGEPLGLPAAGESDGSTAPSGTSRSGSPSIAVVEGRLAARAQSPLDVVALSAHNVDTIYTVDRVAADHEVRISRPEICPGGSGANTAFALARLGRRVAASGIVASDKEGKLLRDSLADEAIDVGSLLTAKPTDRGTGRTLVFTDGLGRRSIYVDPGVNESLAEAVQRDGAFGSLVEPLRSSRIVHLSSFTGAPEFRLQEALVRELPDDVILSFTPGALYTSMGADRLAEILGRTNILAMYEQQLDSLLEASSIGLQRDGTSLQAKLQSLYSWKARRRFVQPLVVVVKSPAPDRRPIAADIVGGAAPEYLSISCGTDTLEDFVPTQARVDHVSLRDCKDATGAGDALTAGVLLGLLEGHTLEVCADLAFLMAYRASREVGARTTLPRRGELDHLMTEWFGTGKLT